MKARKSKSIFFLIFFLSFNLISISSFTPYTKASDYTTYISATDIVKNFKFTTFNGGNIVNEGIYDNKLRFDKQSAWLLYKNDVNLISSHEIGGSTVLKYSIIVRNKINLYTNVRLNQMAFDISKQYGEYLGVKYVHQTLGQVSATRWEQDITWEHYDFDRVIDMRTFNTMNNIFSGRLKMTFDIDPNPIPDTFGDNTETEYGYITVSEAGIENNLWGRMSTDMPTMVELDPSEVSSEYNDDYDEGSVGKEAINLDLNPNTRMYVWEDPSESFDGGIQADTIGSSLNPTNKDGTDIWDPEEAEESMTGCELNYDLIKLSPIVYKWKGKLEYTYHDVLIEDVLGGWFAVVPILKHHWETDQIEYGDVMLHGINRYIQSDIYVVFELWTSVKVGSLTDYYQQMLLEAPEEYYDTLIWSTLAGGWDGSTIREYETPILGWLEELFNVFGDMITWIIVIVVIIAGLYIFIKIGMPIIRGRQRRKEREEIMKTRPK